MLRNADTALNAFGLALVWGMEEPKHSLLRVAPKGFRDGVIVGVGLAAHGRGCAATIH